MHSTFPRDLLRWFDQHGRKDLPWQKNPNAYRVWVSEIMLQQTQVKTVVPYYNRFMQRFPNLKQLAQAPIDEVLHYWSGLGYYARARNLYKSAQIIHFKYRGRFPRDITLLTSLPGIGRSTAGAICAMAFGQHASILDGNVKRVLCRYHAVEGWPGISSVQALLWQLAAQHTPHQRIADYTQAIMDLGATVCTRSKAQCEHCPLQKRCLAFLKNQVQQFPTAKPAKNLPKKHCQMLIIEHGGQVLLQQRPPSGLWGGLWTFPELDVQVNIKDWCTTQLQSDISRHRKLGTFKHSFSHYHLLIQAHSITLTQKPMLVRESNRELWYDLQNPQRIGTTAVVNKLLKCLHKHPDSVEKPL